MIKKYAFTQKLFWVLFRVVLGMIALFSLIKARLVEKRQFECLIWTVISILAMGIPIFAPYYVDYCESGTDKIFFYQFPNKLCLKGKHVDSKGHVEVILDDIDSVEIVKLTKEEKKTKVYYKHFRNKYLKINMKKDNPKYVYIGGYSESQIKDICRICSERK